MDNAKPFCIAKRDVWDAYKRVRANHGAAGVDGQSIEQFEEDVENNLYRLWNRLCSGSYFPPPVRRVDIPKDEKSTRPLGIPTVCDRIAQTVATRYLEPLLEPLFHGDSYGYRPGRSAHQALSVARQRCWRYDWVLDLDLKSFFETIDWELLLRVLRRHTDCTWVLLYVERWLRAPVCMPDGTLAERKQGTPQGAVISPLLANLFLHAAFDRWMAVQHPDIPFERYADDIICHCKSEEQAQALKAALAQRFAQWHLELHPHKTTIVYCKDANRRGRYPEQRFDFLGYTFRPRSSKNAMGKVFVSFAPAVSEKAAKAIRQRMRRWQLHQRNDLALEELARWTHPMLRGWVGYYGRFHASALRRALRTLDDFLVRWAQRKYKRLRAHKGRAWQWLWRVRARQPDLFAHWALASPVGR
jgi:group II intron reverse transcriptase/maturase